MKTILILSGIPYYGFTKQRPQHMAEFFAQQGYRILYLGNGEKKDFLSLNQFESLPFENILNEYSTKLKDEIYILKRIFLDDTKENDSLDHLICRISNNFIAEDLTIFVEHPDWIEHLNSTNPAVKIVYDCIDDWEGFATDLDLGIKNQISQKERKIASIANLVLTSSKRLYAKMSFYNSQVYYLPNGVWTEDYQKKENEIIPKDIKNIKKPIIFFMGGIAGWVDLKLIEFISMERPEYSFVFVGDLVNCMLPGNENIYFLGKKDYSELSLYLNDSQVAIIPFKETNLTASVTPLKYYEYMSSGVPVVATMLPDLVHLAGSKIVRDYQEFLSAIDYYIYLDKHNYKKASLLAKATSLDFDWKKLLKPLCDYIEENGEFSVQEKELFIEETIINYEAYSNNNVIKNELLSFYNLQENYGKAALLFLYEEVNLGDLLIDYNQLSLAYYKIGEIEKSMGLIKRYMKEQKNIIWSSNYYNSLIKDDFLYISFLLKVCGRQYEALELLNSRELTSKRAGLLSSIYFDIDEYNLADDYAFFALEHIDGMAIDEVMDSRCIMDLIDCFINKENFQAAEQLALELMGKGLEMEEAAIKKLGEIYFLVNLPSSNRNL